MSIYVPPRLAPAKASPVGPGAGVLQTEYPLSTFGKTSDQKKMQRAWTLSFEVPWIAAAEDAITERFSGVEWHLEDGEDETIDDAYASPDAQAARMLLEKPSQGVSVGAPYYRSDLWGLTARAMGVCGDAFIFLDQPEAMANTPTAMLPIAPWRFFPEEDANGNLTGWRIDKTANNPGLAVSLEQVLHFMLRRNFTGHFGVGLVESAMRKAGISQGMDDHVNMVIGAGGRLSGILSPQQGVIEGETLLQMERDWRTVVDQSDAAKRLQLVRAPVKFDRTTLTPAELQLREMMSGARDDLLTLWGVPLSIIGGSTPAGLNSGETRKFDEAAIWQGPVHSRLTIFRETIQYQLLDRYATRGAVVELEIDEPEFDDDSPRYDLLGKSLNTPMRNAERRALVNLPPFGIPELDDQIILPATMVPFATAPETVDVTVSAAVVPQITAGTMTPEAMAAGEQSSETRQIAAGEEAKARFGKTDVRPQQAAIHASLVRLRSNLERTTEPRVKKSVESVLKAQRLEIAQRLRKHAAAVERHPRDTSVWFNSEKWDDELVAALRPALMTMAQSVADHVDQVLPTAKAEPVTIRDDSLRRQAKAFAESVPEFVFNYQPPDIHVAAPVVHVPAPIVNIEAQPAANIVVAPPVVNVAAPIIPAPIVTVASAPERPKGPKVVTEQRDGSWLIEDA